MTALETKKREYNNQLRTDWNRAYSAVNKQNTNKGDFIVSLENVDIICNIKHDSKSIAITSQSFGFPDGRSFAFNGFPMNHYAIANSVLQYAKSYNYALETVKVKKELEHSLMALDARTRTMLVSALVQNNTRIDDKKQIVKDLLKFADVVSKVDFKSPGRINQGKDLKANLYLLRDSLRSKLPNIDMIVSIVDNTIGSDNETSLAKMYNDYYTSKPNIFYQLVKCLCITIHPYIMPNRKNSYNNVRGVTNIGNEVGAALDAVKC